VTLTLADGKPYRGWAAFALATRDSPVSRPSVVWSYAYHGKDGVYMLRAPPSGRARLHVRPGQSTFDGRPSGYLERVLEVELPEKGRAEASVQVEAGAKLVLSVTDAGGEAVRGTVRIRDAESRPVPAVFVGEYDWYLTGDPHDEGLLPGARTCWLATALEPGRYEIEITPEGGVTSTHTVVARGGKLAAISVTVE
jgi:hypothetical protein